MSFKGLDRLSHDGSLLQQVGEACHVQRVQQVNFQVEAISDMIAKEWHAAHERDVGDIDRFAIVSIPTVADRESMIDGDM